jgi:hypothetical protein
MRFAMYARMSLAVIDDSRDRATSPALRRLC